MKKIALSVVFALASITAFAQELTFEKTTHNFQNIEYAGDGTYKFKFTNTGDQPLIITKSKGSCGCTVPIWPKEPIMPGESAEIKVKYDTKRPGNFQKTVTVTSNSTKGKVIPNDTSGQTTTRLTIKGVVAPKPTPAEQQLQTQPSSPMMPKAN